MNKTITNPLTRQVLNVFCPTGDGGGVDPTCSPQEPSSTGFKSAFVRQQDLAKEAWQKGHRLEGLQLRTLTRKQFDRLKDKHDLTEGESMGAGFAGEGNYTVLKTNDGTIAVRQNK